MIEQREAHEFNPSGRGLCSVCGLEHKRWAEKEYEEALAAYHALMDGSKEEAEEEANRQAAKEMKIGDTVYWHDADDGKRSGFYVIKSKHTDVVFSAASGAPEDDTNFRLKDKKETVSWYDCDFPPFPPGWVPVKDGRDRTYSMEEVEASTDRLLNEWQEAATKRNRARDALAGYE
jgi:hypothetical protein